MGGIPLAMLIDGTFKKWEKLYTIELSESSCGIASTRYKSYEEKGEDYNFNLNFSEEKDKNFKDRQSYFNGKLNLLPGDSGVRLKEVLDEVEEP